MQPDSLIENLIQPHRSHFICKRKEPLPLWTAVLFAIGNYFSSSSRRLRNANAAALIITPTIIRAIGAESPVRGAVPIFEVVVGVLFTVVTTFVVVVVVVLWDVVVSVSVSVSVVVASVVEVVSVVVLVRLSLSPV